MIRKAAAKYEVALGKRQVLHLLCMQSVVVIAGSSTGVVHFILLCLQCADYKKMAIIHFVQPLYVLNY